MKKNKKIDRMKPGSRPPRYDLAIATELAVEVYEKAGGNASKDEFSAITGNTTKSSSFAAKLNALKNYDLVAEIDEHIKLTETGEQIVAPQEQVEKNNGLKHAFLQIDVFKTVYEKFVGKILPPQEFLKNTFIQSGVPRDLADVWINQFTTSAQFAGLLLDRGDGKFQVRETAAGGGTVKKPSSDEKPNETAHADEKLIEEKPPITTTKQFKTPYQFLIEILDADMADDEQQAVWILMKYLKKKDAGKGAASAGEEG